MFGKLGITNCDIQSDHLSFIVNLDQIFLINKPMPHANSEADALAFLLMLTGAFPYVNLYLRFTNSPFIKRNIKQFLILRNLDKVYKPFLEKYFPFYNSLDPKTKSNLSRECVNSLI